MTATWTEAADHTSIKGTVTITIATKTGETTSTEASDIEAAQEALETSIATWVAIRVTTTKTETQVHTATGGEDVDQILHHLLAAQDLGHQHAHIIILVLILNLIHIPVQIRVHTTGDEEKHRSVAHPLLLILHL